MGVVATVAVATAVGMAGDSVEAEMEVGARAAATVVVAMVAVAMAVVMAGDSVEAEMEAAAMEAETAAG